MRKKRDTLKMMNMNEQEQRKKLVSLMLEVERLKQDGKELDEVLKYIEDNRLVR